SLNSGHVISVGLLRQYATAKTSTRTKAPKSTTGKPRTTKQKSSATKKTTTKPRTKTKTVKPIDDGPVPEGPKSPGTPYTIFFTDFYKQFKPENATLKVTEIGRIAGEKWRSLSNDEKEAYWEKYRNAKSKYEDDFKAWKESLTSKDIVRVNERRKLGKLKGKHVRLLKDSRKPKRPRTAFIQFVSANKNFDESKTFIEQTHELVERWKSMSPEEKK
ncbi:21233_t:CDS:2, partial [Racocetra persica]